MGLWAELFLDAKSQLSFMADWLEISSIFIFFFLGWIPEFD